MSEAAAAAVKHHHDLVRNRDPEFFRELLVTYVLWPRHLHLQIMVSAAERADLVVPALDCALADFRGLGTCDATILLGKLEIFLPAHIALDAPARTLFHQVSKFGVRHFQETVSAHAGGHPLKKLIDDFSQTRLHIVQSQVCGDEAHAAVDVEPDAAGRDHAAFVHVHRRDSAN